jgi:Zn-dependent protease with chaperone function
MSAQATGTNGNTSSTASLDLAALRVLPHLTSESFQHPSDLKATEVLQGTPVLPQIVKFLAGGLRETAWHLYHLSQCIRLGPAQGRALFLHYTRAAEILSLPELPELYISPEQTVNAYALGVKRPAVVITRGLVECMTMPEIMAVLAHELGHVKCRHMTYKTIASLMAKYGTIGIAELIPVVGAAAFMAIQAPLHHWSRMAELSCDRAALLVVQDPKLVATMLAKLGSWPRTLGEVDFESLRQQTEEYERLDDDALAAFVKVIAMLEGGIFLTHPLPINRVHAILQWSKSPQYKNIMTGNYERSEESLPAKRCQECGNELGQADRICTHCGSKSTLAPRGPTCSRCGFPVPAPRPNHCGNCGFNFEKLLA